MPPSPSSPSRFQALQSRLVDGMATRMVDQTTTADAGPWRTRALAGAVAWLLAAPVNLLSLAFAAGALWLVLAADFLPVRILGVLMFLAAFWTRPRLFGRPDHVARLSSGEAPALFGLVERVASVTGAPVPDEIVISAEFNASASRSGPRRRTLELGAPMWVAASPQAKVALLGHELGHFAHGDLRHGLWVGSAFHSLEEWYVALSAPAQLDGILAWGEKAATFPLRLAVGGYLAALYYVNATASRRQELFADLDAIRVGGTDGALELFDTMLAHPVVKAAMTRAAVRPDRPDMWALVASDVEAAGAEDRRRRRETGAAERSRIDDSHPTTALRIRLAERRPRESAGVVLDRATRAQLDKELGEALALAATEARDLITFAW